MRTKIAPAVGLAMLAASVISLCGAEVQSPDRQRTSKENAVTSSHSALVAALHVEQRKLEAGKSTLFNVCRIAKDLRTVELQMSTSSPQRIAAHTRHVSVIQDLKNETDKRIEKGTIAPLDGKLIGQELTEAEAELRHAKRAAE